MIKASELRVGNLVTIAHETNSPIVTVETITPNFINVFDNRAGYDIDFVLPIKITPEWLERFGFEVYGSEPYWKYADGINGMFKNNRFRLFTFQTHGDYVPVDYVHQLQNLYFALTGQELELKEVVKI